MNDVTISASHGLIRSQVNTEPELSALSPRSYSLSAPRDCTEPSKTTTQLTPLVLKVSNYLDLDSVHQHFSPRLCAGLLKVYGSIPLRCGMAKSMCTEFPCHGGFRNCAVQNFKLLITTVPSAFGSILTI